MTDTTRKEKETDSSVCCTQTVRTTKVNLRTTAVETEVYAHGQMETGTMETGLVTPGAALGVSYLRGRPTRVSGRRASRRIYLCSNLLRQASSLNFFFRTPK